MSTQPIWVSAELAKEFEQLKSVEEQEASVKRVIERIQFVPDALKDEVRKPLTEWEAAEKARAQGIKDRIEVIRQHAGMSEDSSMTSAAIARLEAVAIDESFGEFAAEAAHAKYKALTILRAERDKQAAIEAERRKADDAERKRLAEEAREKAEAERRAADLANREAIHRAIMDALTRHGIPNRYAADVVSLLATESIPFVIVEY